jgi:DMSO/TMAO reductase YedYZ heme-binding membrane subunit
MAMGLALSLLALTTGLAAGATQQESWHLAARWTARVGFPVFLLTYLASSLVRLSPAPWSRALARDRRWWGLGFAVSHTVHLVALIVATSLDPEPRTFASLIPGGTAYIFILTMALTSSNAAMRMMGRNWKRLHTAGIHVIWLIFTLAYAKRIPVPETRAIGLTMTTLALAALLLRALALRLRKAPAFA